MPAAGSKLVRWTKEIDDFIRNYPELTAKELGDELGICKTSITRRRKQLGLKSSFCQLQDDAKKAGTGYCNTCKKLIPFENLRKRKQGTYIMTCKECYSNTQKEKLRLKKEQSELAKIKKNNEKRQLEETQNFTCSTCNKEKLGRDYYYSKGFRRKMCKACENEIGEEKLKERIKNGKGWS